MVAVGLREELVEAKRKGIRLKRIATKAGVDYSTVHRAYHGKSRTYPAQEDKIRDALRELASAIGKPAGATLQGLGILRDIASGREIVLRDMDFEETITGDRTTKGHVREVLIKAR